MSTPANTNEVARHQHHRGEWSIEFWPEVAPRPSKFQNARQKGFYDGTCFSPRHQRFHDPRRRSADQGPGQGRRCGHGRGRATRSRPSSMTARTCARHFHGALRTIADSAAASFFICHGSRRSSTINTHVRTSCQKATTFWKKSHHAPRIRRTPDKRMGIISHQNRFRRDAGEVICGPGRSAPVLGRQQLLHSTHGKFPRARPDQPGCGRDTVLRQRRKSTPGSGVKFSVRQ